MTIVVAISLASCSSNDNEMEKPYTTDPVEQTKFFACEVSDETKGTTAAVDTIFTEDDIEWFNVSTREIRFKNTNEQLFKKLMENYHKENLEFHLGENILFTVSRFVADIDSRIFDDLVLYYSTTDASDYEHGTYYLHDCYPLQFINEERVQNNIKKNAVQWKTFVNYLDSKGKLKK